MSEKDMAYINEAIKTFKSKTDSGDIASKLAVEVFDDIILGAMQKNLEIYCVFDHVLAYITVVARTRINEILRSILSSFVDAHSDNVCDFISELKWRRVVFAPLNYGELTSLFSSLYFKQHNEINKADKVFRDTVEAILLRCYINFFQKRFGVLVSSYLNEANCSNIHEVTQCLKIKRGPRNKHNKEVSKIIKLTLNRYPNVSKYSLAKKLASHLSSHRDAPTLQTLMRWIQDIRNELKQEPTEPYERKFKLVFE